MYSWEITKTMEYYNYKLPTHVYLDITQNSPQIDHIVYHDWNSRFEMWDHEGEYWNFGVFLRQEVA